MKVTILISGLLCLAFTVYAELTVEQAVELLNSTPLELYIDYLEPEAQKMLTKRMIVPGEDAQHWCCKVDNGEPKQILKTRLDIAYEKVSLSVTTGTHSCGTWGLGRCTQTTARYHQEIRYVTRYLINPLFEDCPDAHVVCCNGYYKINGNCMHHTHAVIHGQTIIDLKDIGIIPSDNHNSNK